ncbi:acetylxylan esterase [bacterium]|nr:acetylxylan esterase [bacterium]
MKLVLLILFGLAGIAHGAPGIFLRPVFEKSANGIFHKNKEVRFGFELNNQLKDPVEVKVVWQVSTDQKKPVIKSNSSTIKIPADEKRVASYAAKIPEPGFYKGTITCSWEGGRVTKTVQVGYGPEKLLPPLTTESDFQNFWDESRARLKKVDPQYRLIHQPELSKGELNVYEVSMRSFGDIRVRGWYEVPKSKGPHPVILRVPGYGGNMKPIARFNDMIVFSFNPRGHGNSQEDIKGKTSNYWIRGLDDKEGYYYQGAYLDCVRAVDFLCSRKKVDPERIAVAGGSQGGGLSLSTAALDSRISLCAPHIPFLTNWDLYFKTSHWPEVDKWIEAKESRTWQSTLKTMSYFDTMNMAPWIECPVFMGVGLQDAICPPVTCFAVYNRVKGKKEYRVYPHAKHHVDKAHHPLVFNWMREKFGLKPFR